MKKKILALALASLMVFATACGPKKDDSSSKAEGNVTQSTQLKAIAKDDLKVGFVYIGDINDGGYTQAHDQGRIELEKMGIKCKYVENVKEEATEVTTAIENLIAGGCNVIYSTSFGFGKYTKEMAKKYPKVYFGHATGGEYTGNMTTYMGKVEEPRYLAGIVAGLKTKSNEIGYVGAFPIGEVIRGINAFTLGVRSVNPNATVEVAWTNTWYDPAKEKQAAQSLLNKGCDVMAQHQDSTATQVAAQEAGAYAIGYNLPTPTAAPKAYLTAPLYHWDIFYKKDIQSIIDGEWQAKNIWDGMSTGMVSLDKLTSNCAPGTQEKVDAAQKKILDGSFTIFAGPIKDNTGAVKVKEGEKMSDDNIWNMDWFVEGVIGSAKN